MNVNINEETCYAIYKKTCYTIFTLMVMSSFFSDVNADNSALDFRTGSVEIVSTDTIQLNDIQYDGQRYNVMQQLNSDATWQLLSEIPQPASEWVNLKTGTAKIIGPQSVRFEHLVYEKKPYNATVEFKLDGTWNVTDSELDSLENLTAPDDFSYDTYRNVDINIQIIAPGGTPMRYVSVKLYVPSSGEDFSLLDEVEVNEQLEDLDSETLSLLASGKLLTEGQTDKDGRFQQTVQLAAHIKKVRLVASAIGLSNTTVDIPVTDNRIDYVFDGKSASSSKNTAYSQKKK
ncbi:MAG: hypothetical protein ABFS56_17970 [Pseudomonadota bacterium]